MEERRRRFGIYDREAEYTRRLGSYLRRRCGDMLEIKIFPDWRRLKAVLETKCLTWPWCCLLYTSRCV